MKKWIIVVLTVALVVLGSLAITWNFDERVTFKAPSNPLWDEQKRPLSTELTKKLKNEGFRFYTDRGAEADPDGICFGTFGSDEYWVIQYLPETKEVHASAWIVEINWLGHLSAAKRFSELKKTLESDL